MRRAIIILLLAAVAGCGSSPKTTFYALSVTADQETSPSPVAFPVQLVAVHVPPSLDRNEMVRRSNGQSMSISDTDRWSAPLGEMIRNVLSQDMQKRLAKGEVILPDAPAPPGAASIVVTISDFAADADGRITLSGQLESRERKHEQTDAAPRCGDSRQWRERCGFRRRRDEPRARATRRRNRLDASDCPQLNRQLKS